MAITNFVPEIWSAEILVKLRSQLVYAQSGLINRDYEGEIAQAGDTVHITSFDDPAVRSYTKNSDISWDLLTDRAQTITVDQSKYFAFTVDDVDKRQALPGFMEKVGVGAAYNLASATDTFVSGLMSAACSNTTTDPVTGGTFDNDLGAKTVATGTPSTAYDLLVEFRTALVKTNTPAIGRFVVVPPEFYAVLLHDDRFVRYDGSANLGVEALRNGIVGRAAGFDVIESNTVPVNTGVFDVIAGHAMATTYADQIVETEALRLQNQFGDGVRGLHVYGGKVVRPKQLVKAEVTVS